VDGQPSSVCQRVLERLGAELSEKGSDGRPLTFGKVAIAAVVGNEDGAHHISAILFQVLNDVGFSIPAQGVTYWNGEAMHSEDYQDLGSTPSATAATTKTAAANAAHLAGMLRGSVSGGWVRVVVGLLNDAGRCRRGSVALPGFGCTCSFC
jgi:hypothetical protein